MWTTADRLGVVTMGWESSDRAARLPPDWPRIRARILARDPVCRICRRRPATEVDHIQRGDDHRPHNLRGVCSPCHASKSGREGGQAAAARRVPASRPPEKHPGYIE